MRHSTFEMSGGMQPEIHQATGHTGLKQRKHIWTGE